MRAAGRVINIGETAPAPVETWIRRILQAAGSDADLVRVPTETLPGDMWLTREHPQQFVADVSLATELLGWHAPDPATRITESVRWHLEHPPTDPRTASDAATDDKALAVGLPR